MTKYSCRCHILPAAIGSWFLVLGPAIVVLYILLCSVEGAWRGVDRLLGRFTDRLIHQSHTNNKNAGNEELENVLLMHFRTQQHPPERLCDGWLLAARPSDAVALLATGRTSPVASSVVEVF